MIGKRLGVRTGSFSGRFDRRARWWRLARWFRRICWWRLKRTLLWRTHSQSKGRGRLVLPRKYDDGHARYEWQERKPTTRKTLVATDSRRDRAGRRCYKIFIMLGGSFS